MQYTLIIYFYAANTHLSTNIPFITCIFVLYIDASVVIPIMILSFHAYPTFNTPHYNAFLIILLQMLYYPYHTWKNILSCCQFAVCGTSLSMLHPRGLMGDGDGIITQLS